MTHMTRVFAAFDERWKGGVESFAERKKEEWKMAEEKFKRGLELDAVKDEALKVRGILTDKRNNIFKGFNLCTMCVCVCVCVWVQKNQIQLLRLSIKL